MKRLILGDIHGCYAELRELLDKAGLSGDDEIIALGDMVDRGPDSPRVLDFFCTRPNTRSLMGNHERKHLRSFRGEIRPALSQRITRQQLGEERYPEAVARMEGFPRFLELPEAIVVHGFFEPHVPLVEQPETVIVGTLSGERYLKEHYDRPWYEMYDGDKPIIVGHRDYLRTGEPFVHRDRVFAIDTGCCRGGALTGLILPDFRIVSVPAHKDYWTEAKDGHADSRVASAPDESLSWDDIERLISRAGEPPGIPPAIGERILRLKSVLAVAERTLTDLFDHVVRENERVLAQLRAECPFDELSAREQGIIYAARVANTPLAELLHLGRRGELTLKRLYNRFKNPGDVVKFALRIGLLSQNEDNGE